MRVDRIPMRTGSSPWVTPGLLLGMFAVLVMGQQFPLGHFRDFSVPEYYPPPRQLQMKSLLQGQEAVPVQEGRILIKKLRLETFAEDGTAEFLLSADDCLYDPEESTAASGGPLAMETADGRFSTRGRGFLWRERDSVLTISNSVHTVIRTRAAGAPEP